MTVAMTRFNKRGEDASRRFESPHAILSKEHRGKAGQSSVLPVYGRKDATSGIMQVRRSCCFFVCLTACMQFRESQ